MDLQDLIETFIEEQYEAYDSLTERSEFLQRFLDDKGYRLMDYNKKIRTYIDEDYLSESITNTLLREAVLNSIDLDGVYDVLTKLYEDLSEQQECGECGDRQYINDHKISECIECSVWVCRDCATDVKETTDMPKCSAYAGYSHQWKCGSCASE